MTHAAVAADDTPRTGGLVHARVRPLLEPAAVGLYGFLVVALVAGSTGGYLPTTHGWTAVVTLWLAAVATLLRGRLALSGLAVTLVAGLVLFTTWTALSAWLWSPSQTSGFHEVQRDLAYLGIAAAAVALTTRATVQHLLGGALAGVTLLSLDALGTRLLPDRLGDFDSTAFGYRLATPITYWNGLGIFTVMGILLALGFAARATTLAARALAAAAIPLLVATMYFTFSRGAWLALGVGLVVAVATDRRRLQLLAVAAVLAPWAALAVAGAHDRPGLTTVGSTLGQAIDDGHSLVAPLALLALVSGATAAAAGVVERRVPVPGGVRVAFAVVCVGALIAGIGAAWAREGAPWTLADRAWTQFNAPPKKTGSDQSERLLQLSSNGRLDLWKTSWDGFQREPALGTGAGSFWQEWAASPRRSFSSQEGHSLWAEVLGELGLTGLLLLAVALGAPLLAGLRARGTPLVPLVLAAYAAWLAHASIDWDWELAGVGAVAMVLAVGLLRADPTPVVRGALPEAVFAGACVGLSVIAVFGLLGSRAIDQATAALARDDPKSALAHLDAAARWAPWSSQPDELRANVYLDQGKRARAAAAYRAAIAKDESSWLLWSAYASVLSGRERERALARVQQLNPAR